MERGTLMPAHWLQQNQDGNWFFLWLSFLETKPEEIENCFKFIVLASCYETVKLIPSMYSYRLCNVRKGHPNRALGQYWGHVNPQVCFVSLVVTHCPLGVQRSPWPFWLLFIPRWCWGRKKNSLLRCSWVGGKGWEARGPWRDRAFFFLHFPLLPSHTAEEAVCCCSKYATASLI